MLSTTIKKKIWLLPAALAAAAIIIIGGIMIREETVRRNTRIVTWAAPEGIAPYPDTTITVNGQGVFVYSTAVNHNRVYETYPKLDRAPVATFDFEGRAEVRIAAPGVTSAVVRPLSLGIRPAVRDGAVCFTLDKPALMTIELNGDAKRALHLFANPIEADAPRQGDPNVIYLGPGIHEPPVIRLKSNQTLYIAGGAVVRSKIVAEKAENIRVTGRGIIDGSVFDRWTQLHVPMDFRLCKNVRVDGVTILDPAGWTLNTFACQGVRIDNVKIVSARPNGDGITTQSCSDFIASGCFVRSWDDSLVVKNYGDGTSHNILFKDITIWTDLAQSCEIGFETKGPEMYNIGFENITVIHNYHKPVLSIHNSDQAYVHDIHYKDITVEDAEMGEGDGLNYLIDLTVAESQWTTSKERGRIENVSYENIRVLGGRFPECRFMGYDAEHGIQNVTIDGLNILGKRIKTPEDGRFAILGFADGIQLK